MAMTIISQVDRLNYLNYLNYLTTITSQIDRLNYLNYLTNFTYFRQSSSQHQEGLHPAKPRRFTSRNTKKVYISHRREYRKDKGLVEFVSPQLHYRAIKFFTSHERL